MRLDTVASVKQTLGPAVIGRFDLQYAATFYGTPTIPLGDAVDKVKAATAEILPIGYTVKMIGQAEEFGKTVQYMIFAFALALVLLYMVLASQFNSFIQPFIIMVAQPLAIIGGVMALWLFSHTLNIYSMIGLVLLIGLVAKNSILLVDLTNQRRAEGMGVDEALSRSLPDPDAAGADDLADGDPGTAAGGAGPGGGRGNQRPAGGGGDRRHDHLHPAHPGGGAGGGLFPGGRRPGALARAASTQGRLRSADQLKTHPPGLVAGQGQLITGLARQTFGLIKTDYPGVPIAPGRSVAGPPKFHSARYRHRTR